LIKIYLISQYNLVKNGIMKHIALYSIIVSFLICSHLNTQEQSLEKNFKNPPESSKPKTWMHAMSSNMSKEGLTKDL
jgi:hypothetical protein